MLDPIPPPPEWLRNAIRPYALFLNLPSLPDHIHEVVLAFAFYQSIHSFISPWLSPKLFPRHYPNFNRRTKLNWDVHVVSFVQSSVINSVALWVMFTDKERKDMNTGERVYGYTGACGLTQALATGYFIYDLLVSAAHVKIFGIGMVFHGLSALWVFSLGFVSILSSQDVRSVSLTVFQRPFVNFYTPTFILYELSSPFLNIHWFLDKINMTGGKAQWYNGMMLLFTFFSCRLIWGTYQSVHVYIDMWKALSQTWSASASSSSLLDPVNISAQVFQARDGSLCMNEACAKAQAQVDKYSKYTARGTPTWLVVTYVVSNLVLNTLNYYWFSKMVETVLKRFRSPTKENKKGDIKQEPLQATQDEIASNDIVLDAAAKLEQEQGGPLLADEQRKFASALDINTTGLAEELRKRKNDPS